MIDPMELIALYFDLLAYCEAKEGFDAKIFKERHDEYSKKYQKLDQSDQGLIAEHVLIRLKDA